MSDNYIQDVLTYQDLEKINFSNGLKENPSDYSQFVGERLQQIIDESTNYKTSSFVKAHTDLARYMDMEHNANNFKVRNGDVMSLQSEMERNNNALLSSRDADYNNSRRQFEINEYYYYNKLETLFFLQLFFISTLLMAIIVYAQKMGMIAPQFAGFLTLILLAVVLVTGVYRWYYTKNTRDTRLWHRRKFAEPTSVPVQPSVKCDLSGNAVFDINSVIPESYTKCGSSISKNAKAKYNEMKDKMEAETLGYFNTGRIPRDPDASRLGSDSGLLKGCSL